MILENICLLKNMDHTKIIYELARCLSDPRFQYKIYPDKNEMKELVKEYILPAVSYIKVIYNQFEILIKRALSYMQDSLWNQ